MIPQNTYPYPALQVHNPVLNQSKKKFLLPQTLAQKGIPTKKFDEILPHHPLPRNILFLFRGIFVLADIELRRKELPLRKNKANRSIGLFSYTMKKP